MPKENLAGLVSQLNTFEPISSLGRWGKDNVFVSRYNPRSSRSTLGLGIWPPVPPAIAEHFPEQPGSWLEEPDPGQLVVIKKVHSEASPFLKHRERLTLLRTNELFKPDEKSRPIRLHGYGNIPTSDDPFSYLVLEHVPWNYSPLSSYDSFDFRDYLRIAKELGSILVRTNKARIAHDDLEGFHAMDHILWNPIHQNLRIIDWDASKDFRYPIVKSSDRNFCVGDQQGLANILKFGLVGGVRPRYSIDFDMDIINRILSSCPDKVAATILEKFTHYHLGDKLSYSMSPRGTVKMLEDVGELATRFDRPELVGWNTVKNDILFRSSKPIR